MPFLTNVEARKGAEGGGLGVRGTRLRGVVAEDGTGWVGGAGGPHDAWVKGVVDTGSLGGDGGWGGGLCGVGWEVEVFRVREFVVGVFEFKVLAPD